MKPVDRFQPVERQRDPVPRIVLRSTAGGTEVTLDAAALVAQYAVSSARTLVILDEDTPYEEQLHLVLLEDGDVLDHVVIGAPYANGAFRADEPSGDTLRFQFEGAATWTLSVKAEGSRGLGGLPAGARRRARLLAPRYIFLSHGKDE